MSFDDVRRLVPRLTDYPFFMYPRDHPDESILYYVMIRDGNFITAAEFRTLLENKYLPRDVVEALEIAVEVLWGGWSRKKNLPLEIFDLSEVGPEALRIQCARICRVVPSKRGHIMRGLSELGADVGILWKTAKHYL